MFEREGGLCKRESFHPETEESEAPRGEITTMCVSYRTEHTQNPRKYISQTILLQMNISMNLTVYAWEESGA